MFDTEKTRWILSSASLLVMVQAVAACSKQEPSPAASPAATQAPIAKAQEPAAPPNPAVLARRVFQTKCNVCHGDHGAGDGPGAAALNPKPRAFGDAAWQASVTDEHIQKTIVEGGVAVGKSPGMAANPELKDKPEVVKELVKIVRGFKKD